MEHTGSKFDGTCVSGRFEGDGKFTFPNGNTYVGGFKNGRFHGKGTIYIQGKGAYQAEWEHGKVSAPQGRVGCARAANARCRSCRR